MATAVRQSLLWGRSPSAWRSVPMWASRARPSLLRDTQLEKLRAWVLRASINLLERGNPLGIEDDDLPLYFRGSGADRSRLRDLDLFLADRGGLTSCCGSPRALCSRLEGPGCSFVMASCKIATTWSRRTHVRPQRRSVTVTPSSRSAGHIVAGSARTIPATRRR